MNLAVICLAYIGNNRGVERLARYFSGSNARIFLHVDAKTDEESYRKLEPLYKIIHFVEDRTKIFWGGYSIVRATISCVKEANQTSHFTHYLLITEDSIPLVSISQLFESFASDVEYIKISLASANLATDRNWITERYVNYYCFDGPATNPRVFDVADKVLTTELCDRVSRAGQLIRQGKFPLDRLYHGPSWWGLSRARLNDVMAYMDQNPWFVASFEFSAIPEEQLFHTIICRSGEIKGRDFMHADFSKEPKPYTYTTFDECRALQSSGALFARKAAIASSGVDLFITQL